MCPAGPGGRGRDMSKKDKHERDDARLQSPSAAGPQDAGAATLPKMKRKPYEREMRVLHGELVAMQEWVKSSGARICIVFEGRDTAGKGGTIKRITERVSPRVFRVVALPAPTEREKSQMYVQRYVLHTDDKKRGRLNIISHLLSQVPYKPLAAADITLPKRQKADGYAEPELPLRYIPTPF